MGEFLIAFEPIILVIHFIAAFFLVTFILLQSGKGSDIGAAFGAGGSQSLLGTTGASTILTKATIVIAMVFLVTSLSLATTAKFTATGGSGHSIIQDELSEGTKDSDTTTSSTDENNGTENPLEE